MRARVHVPTNSIHGFSPLFFSIPPGSLSATLHPPWQGARAKPCISHAWMAISQRCRYKLRRKYNNLQQQQFWLCIFGCAMRIQNPAFRVPISSTPCLSLCFEGTQVGLITRLSLFTPGVGRGQGGCFEETAPSMWTTHRTDERACPSSI